MSSIMELIDSPSFIDAWMLLERQNTDIRMRRKMSPQDHTWSSLDQR